MSRTHANWSQFSLAAFAFLLALGGVYRVARTPRHEQAPEAVGDTSGASGDPSEAGAIRAVLDLAIHRGIVVDPEGTPIPHAAVELSPPRIRTFTDSEGAFVFPPLPRRDRWITAAAAGHRVGSLRASGGSTRVELTTHAQIAGIVLNPDATPSVEAELTLVGSGIWPARTSKSDARGRFAFREVPEGIYEVRARSGDLAALPRRGLDVDAGGRAFVTFHLEAGARLGGVVRDSTTGRPIVDAKIATMSESIGLAPRETRSDRDGRFQIAGLRPTEHRVSVRAAGYVPILAQQWTPGTELDLSLEPGATLEGSVLNSRGEPVENARIEIVGTAPGSVDPNAGLGVTDIVPALPLDSFTGLSEPVGGLSASPEGLGDRLRNTADSAEAVLTITRSHADGSFEVRDLASGYLQLVASAEGHSPGASPRLFLREGSRTRGVQIVLGDAGILSGRVTNVSGASQSGMWVEARSAQLPWPRLSATDEEGEFEFEDVAGSIDLRVLGAEGIARRVEVREDEITRVVLTLPAPEERFRGVVRSLRGTPIAGARLRLTSMAPGRDDRRQTLSDDFGEFEFVAPPPGPWKLRVEHRDFALSPELDIDPESPPAVVRLQRAIRVVGSATSRDGDADAVHVTLTRLDGAPLVFDALTDETGAFEIPRVSPGSYRLRVQSPGYVPHTRDFHFDAEPTLMMLRPIELEAAHAIHGQVLDVLGRPVHGARLRIATAGREQNGEFVTTNRRGRFILDAVPAGQTVVEATHPLAGSERQSVRVPAMRDPLPIRIRLPRRVDQRASAVAPPIREGVPITLEVADGAVYVLSVASSRARAAGVSEGDRVTAIDGIAVESIDDAQARLEGDRSVPVVLELERGDQRFRLRVARERW